ncbi:lipoprotein LpqH [Staphylococcus chromogenes]|nr:lipoprotein LpqH [Staphylococcus chromogenes]
MIRRISSAAALLAIGTLLASCGSDSSDPSTSAAETTTPVVPTISVDTKNTTGYAMLNGYVILPANSPAICTKQEDKLTVILGDVGSQTAASAIINAGQVTDVTINDPEDTLTLTGGNGHATLTKEGPVFTLSGEAPGVRRASLTSGEIPMTFEMSFECP